MLLMVGGDSQIPARQQMKINRGCEQPLRWDLRIPTHDSTVFCKTSVRTCHREGYFLAVKGDSQIPAMPKAKTIGVVSNPFGGI